MRGRWLILVLAASLGLAACRVSTTVTVRVNEDGSGAVVVRVVLDRDAVRAAEVDGGTLESRVRLADLDAAGWRSSGWERSESGGAALVVRKRFARPQDVATVVAELSGPDGPLRRFRLTRDRAGFRTEWSFSGVADLRALRSGVTADPELVARLTAEKVDVAALDRRLVADLRDALRFRMVAELPNASPRRIPVPVGTRAVMRAESISTDVARIVLLAVGIGLGGLAVALLVVGELRSRRRRAFGPGGVGSTQGAEPGRDPLG